jgi:hypothetical protein
VDIKYSDPVAADTLTDWLRIQIDSEQRFGGSPGSPGGQAVLRRVSALRSIVDSHEAEHECPGRHSVYCITPDDPCPTLRQIGFIFSHRAGYLPEWSIEASEETFPVGDLK